MDPSRGRPPRADLRSALALLIFALTSLIAWSAAAGQAVLPLQLEVSINAQPTNLVGGFAEEQGELASTPAELAELGLEIPPALKAQPLVRLRDLPGLTYRYDRDKQTIDLTIGDDGRRRHQLDAGRRKKLAAERSAGAVVNYALVGTVNDDDIKNYRYDPWAGQGTLAAQLDGRVFTPYGMLETSVIGRTGSPADGEDVIRLDSAWTTENPDTLMRYRLGDTVSGGLAWTRPIRIAGAQVQRSFDLRPDLVTAPLPSLGGTAAVPSTVDVYVNNIKTFSQAVPAGPFSITNLPVMSGAGNARIVVRDATGRETATDQAFFSASTMLAPGLYDYSVEGGVARRSYGTLSNDYDDQPVASASARYGLSRRLTLEAHAEGGAGLANAGIGAVTPLGDIAVLSASLSGSRYDDRTGTKATAGLEAQLFGLSLAAQTQRTFGGFRDLASVTGDGETREDGFSFFSSKPLRSLDLVSLGMPVRLTGGNLNLAVVSSEHEDGDRQRIVTASYSQRLLDNVSAYTTGYRDIGEGRMGVFAGVSISLGGGHHVSLGATHDDKGTGATVDYVKSSNMTPGSVGWRATVTRGATERIGGQVDWTGSYARVEAGALNTERSTHASLVITGAVASAGGGIFLSNRIDDSFAVVDAGAPGVKVLHENRVVGVTGTDGRMLVPYLLSNQENRISIDPLTLPLDIEAPPSNRNVVPASRSGVVVELRGRQIDAAAVVVLKDANGAVLPPGATGKLAGSEETFVVGYDGEAYLRGLAASNVVTVEVSGKACTARFDYKRGSAVQGRIEGVICR